MFSLSAEDLSGGVLDCGAGPASFTAEMSASNIRAVAVDPIYAFSGSEILARFEAVVEPMISQVRATPEDWTWSYHRDTQTIFVQIAVLRWRSFWQTTSGDCASNATSRVNYLLFDSGSFGLAVCSHLLFLYSDLLSEDFHIRSVLELCRVAGEVRLFPLLTLRRELSPHLAAVRSALDSKGLNSEIVRVHYELQRGGNQMLRVYRA